MLNVGDAPLITDWSNAFTSAILASSLSINAPAAVTFVVSVTSALASIPSSLLWSAASKGTDVVPLIVNASVSNVPSISTLPDISKLGATTSCGNTKLSFAALHDILASVEAFTASCIVIPAPSAEPDVSPEPR